MSHFVCDLVLDGRSMCVQLEMRKTPQVHNSEIGRASKGSGLGRQMPKGFLFESAKKLELALDMATVCRHSDGYSL